MEKLLISTSLILSSEMAMIPLINIRFCTLNFFFIITEIEKLKKNVSLSKSELEEIKIHLTFTKSYDKILNDTRLKERMHQLDSLKAKIRQLVNNITYANDRVESVIFKTPPYSLIYI